MTTIFAGVISVVISIGIGFVIFFMLAFFPNLWGSTRLVLIIPFVVVYPVFLLVKKYMVLGIGKLILMLIAVAFVIFVVYMLALFFVMGNSN